MNLVMTIKNATIMNAYSKIAAIMVIAGLFMLPIAGSDPAAAQKESVVYDPRITDYIQEILEQTGTTTTQETKDGDTWITTNTLNATSASKYTLSTTTTINGELVHDESFVIVVNDNGTYRLINTERGIDQTFTTNKPQTRGSANYNLSSATITLDDRGYANDGDVLGLSDSYNSCAHARFDAGVDTTDDTGVEWDVSDRFWSYCFVPLDFDYVKIKHEGQTRTSSSNNSDMTFSNSNGAGWYKVVVYVYYN